MATTSMSMFRTYFAGTDQFVIEKTLHNILYWTIYAHYNLDSLVCKQLLSPGSHTSSQYYLHSVLL
jgi:hypothetical protein